jgi:hypothetical protein
MTLGENDTPLKAKDSGGQGNPWGAGETQVCPRICSGLLPTNLPQNHPKEPTNVQRPDSMVVDYKQGTKGN